MPASAPAPAARACLLCALLIAWPLAASELPKGETPALVETWSMDKGLPQTSVTAVVQTRDDYLWVGTDGGLARFDGMRFTTYRVTNTPALASHAITRLFEDRAGDLWVGTENGLVRHRGGVFEPAGLEGREISALSQDPQGNLWVATNAGVYRQHEGEFHPVAHDPARPPEPVQTILADSSGRVWIGFERGVVMRYEQESFVTVDAGELLRGEVLAMAESPRGTIWFGTTNGLVRYKDGAFARFGTEDGLASRRISALHADHRGGLWVASSALQRMPGDEPKAIETVAPTPARIFQDLWLDREGNVWAGTAGDGLMRVRAAPFQMIGLNARNAVNGFRTVMQDATGVLWLAQGALGYTRIGGERDLRRLAPGGAEHEAGEVLAVYKTRRGELWIGGRDALHIVRDGHSASYPEFAGVRAIFEDTAGRIWMGRQRGGITRWEDGTFVRVPLPSSVATCTPSSFAETAAGDVWVGTWNHGVLRLRGAETRVFTPGGPGGEMRCVYVDREDRVWIGTRGRGLAMLDGEQWLMPEWSSELIDQQVISIIEDESDHLWLAAPRGVFMARRDDLVAAMRGTLELNQLRIVNATEGMRQEIADLACFPAVWRTQEGHLWFATQRGIMRIEAERTRPNPRPPTVHIDRVLFNGQRQPARDEVVLPPDTHGLVIEYTGLSFTAPGRIRFQYRLHGLDDAWVEADDRRSAHYSKLPPGRYRFQVVASNADGVWNDRGASLTLVQQAHFYQQPWIPWVTGLLVLAGAAGAYRWRSMAHARERRRLETGIAERTHELRIAKEHAEASTRAKAEFLEGISHEIRNPLNGIIGLVAMLREAPLDARERELAQSLGACARGLARVFDEVLNFTRLEHGGVMVSEKPFSLTPLVEEVAAMFRMMARQRGSEIVVRREGEVPERWVGDGEKIKSILGNFVSNALKYAPGSPVEILVQCDAADEFGADVTFNVTDRGPGIPAEEQERIFEKFVRGSTARAQRTPGTGLGLAACRALAELMGGHVAVESPATSLPAGGAGMGATFFLRVRLKRDRNPAPAAEGGHEEMPAPTGRALIVEDQPYNQIVVRRIAERLGFASDVAHNPADALARFARQPYAVVFADWELPDLKGDELTRRLRQLPGGPDAVVIATTAHDSDEIRRACAAAGMDGFALKPFETETIAKLLETARTRRSAAAGAAAPLDTRVFRFVGYDDPEQAGQAARLYLDILDQEVALLEGAMSQQDSAGAAAAAHRIKSHAGLVDAADLRETADRLQREALSSPAAALADLQQDLIRHAGVLRERLRSWRDADE